MCYLLVHVLLELWGVGLAHVGVDEGLLVSWKKPAAELRSAKNRNVLLVFVLFRFSYGSFSRRTGQDLLAREA